MLAEFIIFQNLYIEKELTNIFQEILILYFLSWVSEFIY